MWMSDYIQMLNSPELHLLLRVGHKLYDAIMTAMSEDEISTHEVLLKQTNISRGCYRMANFRPGIFVPVYGFLVCSMAIQHRRCA